MRTKRAVRCVVDGCRQPAVWACSLTTEDDERRHEVVTCEACRGEYGPALKAMGAEVSWAMLTLTTPRRAS
jgi:hypothetical protein